MTPYKVQTKNGYTLAYFASYFDALAYAEKKAFNCGMQVYRYGNTLTIKT